MTLEPTAAQIETPTFAENGRSPETTPETTRNWTIEDSEELYRIRGWGEPYFSINAAGNITVSPQGDRGGSLDLYELVEALKKRNLELPLLLRFPDILADRIERLNSSFAKAIARYNYEGSYRGVFPVKCNQQRHLIEDLVKFGQPYKFGLEAGSKPELTIALACLTTPGALLICNGYKDREYIEMAMLASRLGHTTIIVIEQPEEVDVAIAASQKLGISPVLGVRAKLSCQGCGRWGHSSGEGAKFGLSVPEIVEAVDRLEAAGMLDCLQLLHFHIGSQISSISTIKDAIREAAQTYVELAKLGANMQYLDVGGGLAVDYDGSKTNFHASKNYNMQNYANDIVAEVKEACEEKDQPVPILISESGRAISAHQSVLICDVLGTSETPTTAPEPGTGKEHRVLKDFYETYRSMSPENYQEAYHDAIQFKEEAISLFNFGYVSIRERAKAEQLYWACCRKVLAIARQQEDVPPEFAELENTLASIYYINLSIFQSVPDSWAIEQLFPIAPLHRLNEEPTQRGTFADLTCDSDGRIDRFIDRLEVKSAIELHPLRPDEQSNAGGCEPYYLGMFLVGAYQEILGSLHNLFGDTNAVHIKLTPTGYEIEHVVKGDTMTEVLGYVQYNWEDLLESLRKQSERALSAGQIDFADSQLLLGNYERSLRSYTYLSD